MVMPAPIPADDAARVLALRRYGILGTAPDERFDLFSRLGTWIFRVPMCAINLVDEDTTFFKSTAGFAPYTPARRTSICAHAIAQGDPIMEVEDMSLDTRFHDHTICTERGGRFYAGALLTSACGHNIGTLCLVGQRPRVLDPEERLQLLALAKGVGAVLELHRQGIALLEMANRDVLTGLHNRRHFETALQRAIDGTAPGRQAALLYIDLDRFKKINDTLGHAAGDALLCEVARRLTATARGNDVVARLAGDEFVLLIDGVADAQPAVLLAERLLAAFAAPFVLDGQVVPIRGSVGIALCPEHAGTAAELLHCADLALYDAKKAGRNRVCVARQQAQGVCEPIARRA